ncbi:hypothetical protein [Mesorhizobium sp.]|uniref:hypothetical protein n=1 Tax=Mesorhizobium sp. TaxID=1871066 RepID=UPI000FEA504D|nr:hypothetical protein [Mesorhizobium sp.]RWI35548.1 MAG: hypothetical protein EOR14_29025 [Mesorhizobium sp.]RWJ66445.1 MAG: hypothetical protein EOR34_28945 [Mesorhizobium sp.]
MGKRKNTALVIEETVAEVLNDTTDVTLPMGEDGNQLVDELEALNEEVQDDAGTDEDQAEDEQSEAPEATYEELLAAELTDHDAIEATRTVIAGAFDERAAFQRAKDSDNETIHRSLNKSRARLIQERAVACLLATSTAPDFITDSMHQGSAYNVYAADKLCDIVSALNGDVLHNAINVAVMKSLFAFRAANETFTGEMAKAACSKQIRIAQPSLAKLLIRHTVSPGTAPTQASSTMQALQTLGIVVNKGSQKYPAYHLTDTPQTRRMEQVLRAA